jgi:hypothetical protein
MSMWFWYNVLYTIDLIHLEHIEWVFQFHSHELIELYLLPYQQRKSQSEYQGLSHYVLELQNKYDRYLTYSKKEFQFQESHRWFCFVILHMTT